MRTSIETIPVIDNKAIHGQKQENDLEQTHFLSNIKRLCAWSDLDKQANSLNCSFRSTNIVDNWFNLSNENYSE